MGSSGPWPSRHHRDAAHRRNQFAHEVELWLRKAIVGLVLDSRAACLALAPRFRPSIVEGRPPTRSGARHVTSPAEHARPTIEPDKVARACTGPTGARPRPAG